MNGLIGILAGAAVAIGLLSSASGEGTTPDLNAVEPYAPGEAHATETVVAGHTTYAVLEIDEDDW